MIPRYDELPGNGKITNRYCQIVSVVRSMMTSILQTLLSAVATNLRTYLPAAFTN
jgi:hypothetical protein